MLKKHGLPTGSSSQVVGEAEPGMKGTIAIRLPISCDRLTNLRLSACARMHVAPCKCSVGRQAKGPSKLGALAMFCMMKLSASLKQSVATPCTTALAYLVSEDPEQAAMCKAISSTCEAADQYRTGSLTTQMIKVLRSDNLMKAFCCTTTKEKLSSSCWPRRINSPSKGESAFLVHKSAVVQSVCTSSCASSCRLAREEIDSKVAALRLQLDTADQLKPPTEQGYAEQAICAHWLPHFCYFAALTQFCFAYRNADETHAAAKRQVEKMVKLRTVFGLPQNQDSKEGEAFDRELQEKRKQARIEQRELAEKTKLKQAKALKKEALRREKERARAAKKAVKDAKKQEKQRQKV